MRNSKKILFPTDFSHCARNALNHAMFFAEQWEAELHILHVSTLHGETAGPGTLELPESLLKRAQDLADSTLKEWLEPHRDKPLQIREFKKRALYASPAILSHIEQEGIDLVVMGTHGRRGWKRIFLGSVAEEVIREASCPVLALRELGADVEHNLPSFKRFLVPIDFSAHSKFALEQAIELAREFGAEIYLLHVVNRMAVPTFYSPMLGSFGESYEEIKKRCLQEMHEWTRPSEQDVHFVHRVLIGETADHIAKQVSAVGADLIVMATHGLTGLQHMLLGSNTERVLRTADAPILILKSSFAPQSGLVSLLEEYS